MGFYIQKPNATLNKRSNSMPITYHVDGKTFNTLKEAQEYEKKGQARKQLFEHLSLELQPVTAQGLLRHVTEDLKYGEKLIALLQKVIY